jgi:hypothetical protein
MPNRLVQPQPDKPAKQQIEVEPLDQLLLAPNDVQHLKQQGLQQLLGRNRRPSLGLVDRVNGEDSSARIGSISALRAGSGWSAGIRSSSAT